MSGRTISSRDIRRRHGARALLPALIISAGLGWIAPALAQSAPPAASSTPAQPAAVSSAPHAPAAVAAPAAPAPASTPAAKPEAAATAVPSAAVAQPPANGFNTQAAVQSLTQIQTQAQATNNDTNLAALGAQSAAIEAQAQAAMAANAKDLAVANAKLQRYAKRKPSALTASERREQAELLAQRKTDQTDLGQANTAAQSASTVFDLIAERRRNEFSARVFRRSPSPISPGFWTSLADTGGVDMRRLGSAGKEAIETALEAPEPRGLGGLAFGLGLGLVLPIPVRLALEKLARRHREDHPHEGFARTGQALWLAAVDTVLPGLAAIVLRLGAQWGGLLSEKADTMAGAFVVAVTWSAAILALGRALATDMEADRRLLSLPHRVANRVRLALWAVAVVTAAGFLLTRLNYVVGASVAATIAANCLVSAAYAGVAGLIVLSGGVAPIVGDDSQEDDSPHSSTWTLMSLALTLAILATLGADLAGYTTLAALISGQIFWLSVVGAVGYLLLRFIDDLCQTLFRRGGRASRLLSTVFGLRGSTIDQTGVLLAAALQLLVIVGSATLALTPFGQSGDLLLADLGRLGGPLHIGTAVISPSAIFTGLASLVIGLGIVRLVRGWVVRRYLPVTDWDAGLRTSVSTGIGYLGVCITLVCALAAMGLGFQQIALIASALSVGIGFGLQQIVQNFVSGIILLVERPVKVNDWVKVGDVEGDIRRIRVRATEIQAPDRSTVLVPNSNLITGVVQNKTMGLPRGRIQLQVSIAEPFQARQAADLIAKIAAGHDQVLKDPAPVVFIDSIANGGVNFNCFFYVISPRDSYKVRSALYFAVAEAFHENKIPFLTAVAT